MNVTGTTQKLHSGTCPHGNPIGACPICAGLSGGGGGLANNKARRPGEMTYDQCYAVWQQMLKTKANIEEQKNLQKMEYLKSQENIKNFSDKIIEKLAKISFNAAQVNNVQPTIASRLQAFATSTIFIVFNIVSKFVQITQSTINFIHQKLIDISDKLNAIYGELKLKIEKFLSDKKSIKQKLKSLFEIFSPFNTKNENKKFDEEKIIYQLKTKINEIKERFSRKNPEVTDDRSN